MGFVPGSHHNPGYNHPDAGGGQFLAIKPDEVRETGQGHNTCPIISNDSEQEFVLYGFLNLQGRQVAD